MSSPTSDSFVKTLFNTITDYLSELQRKNIFTKQRFQSIRQYFFQSIGFSILLYYFLHIPILFYSFLKLIFQLLSILFSLPFKTMELLLPKTTNYAVLVPLFWFSSIASFLIARFSHKTIDIHLKKRYNLTKNYSFTLVFVILLLFQSVFILRPIAASIQEQRKLSLSSAVGKQTVIELSDKEIVQPNTFINNDGNRKRQLNDDKREEHTSITNRVKPNETDKTEMSSSLQKDVEDEQSYPINHVKEDMIGVEKLVPNLPLKVSSKDEEKLLLRQQADNLLDPNQQFSSKTLEKSSVKSKPDEQKSLTFRQKFNSWLEADFHQLWFLSKKHTQHIPQNGVSSIYTAYTDLNCYTYTEQIDRDRLAKQKYISFLDAYRHQSPFPVYLSILKSHGPKCYHQYPTSSCAISSKSFFSNFKQHLYTFIRFGLIITIPVILFIVILIYYQRHNRSSNKNQQIISDKINDLSFQQTSPTITKTYPLDEKLDKELRSWLERKQHNDYQSISETCRTALNDIFSKQYEQLYIEALQFANAKIDNISQTSVDPPVITALLNIDYLIFNIINQTNDQHYSIEIRKLTGELEIFVINNIEVKFKQMEIDSAEIIDSKNILSFDEKQSVVKLLTEIISQTIVQFCVHVPDDQNNIVNESITPPSTPRTPSQPSSIYQQHETPLVTPIDDNNQQIVPQKQPRKLLIRIVKAVKLHDVEQPFCVIELNHPKQTHQTSIAKNGLNPFWDEHFLFECNDKSNEVRLQVIDHKKPNKKLNTNTIDKIYADVSIPFSYATSTIYKQDVRITPQYPESIIRIEFSTLSEDEAAIANNGFDIESLTNSLNWSNISREVNKIEREQSPSDEISILPYNTDVLPKDYSYENNFGNYVSTLPRSTTNAFITPPDDDIRPDKPRKLRSFMSSLRHLTFPRRKKHPKKGKESENGLISPINSPTQTNSISHSLSAEPFLYPNTAEPTSFRRDHSFSRSFRNLFRSSSKKKKLHTDNFIIDHPDLLCASTPTRKKHSFLRRFKSKQKKQPIVSSANSLNSFDCTRTESVQNTPVRANGNRPVTMTKPLV